MGSVINVEEPSGPLFNARTGAQCTQIPLSVGTGSVKGLFFFVDHKSRRSMFSVTARAVNADHRVLLLSSSQETAGAQMPGWAASWKTRGKDSHHTGANNQNNTKHL